MLLVADNLFVQTPEGERWMSAHAKEPTLDITYARTDLPDGHPMAQMRPRPVTDNRVAVWVYGTFPDATVKEDLVADGVVGNGDFGFSTYLRNDPVLAAQDGSYWHCCPSAPPNP